MSTQPNHALNWHELHDEHDRPCWEAASIYHDDGSPLYFRIRLKGYFYREDSDPELIGVRRNWLSLEAAKGDLQREHERMLHAENCAKRPWEELDLQQLDDSVRDRVVTLPGHGDTTRAHVSPPQFSEYIHPAHCEPDAEDEPPSEWRDVALYLAMALVALIAVALLYGGTARASALGPEIVVNGSFDDGSAWTPGYSWQILPAPGGLAFHNEGYNWPMQQITASLIPGTTYRVSYVISGSYTSSDARHRFRIRGTTSNATCAFATGDGVHVCYLVAPPGAYSLQVLPASGFAGILDDVSVREVLP